MYPSFASWRRQILSFESSSLFSSPQLLHVSLCSFLLFLYLLTPVFPPHSSVVSPSSIQALIFYSSLLFLCTLALRAPVWAFTLVARSSGGPVHPYSLAVPVGCRTDREVRAARCHYCRPCCLALWPQGESVFSQRCYTDTLIMSCLWAAVAMRLKPPHTWRTCSWSLSCLCFNGWKQRSHSANSIYMGKILLYLKWRHI